MYKASFHSQTFKKRKQPNNIIIHDQDGRITELGKNHSNKKRGSVCKGTDLVVSHHCVNVHFNLASLILSPAKACVLQKRGSKRTQNIQRRSSYN